jgi:8-oxo-dGTP pyrophosphatase MutT (NUDIX family)
VVEDRLSGFGDGEFDPPHFCLSTAIYAERDDGCILLLQRAEGSAMAGMYFLPGGVVDAGEEPYEAARRELREEAGLEIEGDLTIVGTYPMWIYGRDFLQLSFHGRVAGDIELSHEHTAHQWVQPSEFAELFAPETIAAVADGDERIERLLTSIATDAARFLASRES